MSDVLNADQRRHLDTSVQRARAAAERAAADALHALAVAEPSRPAYLSQDDNALRLALREKARQLGDDTARSGAKLTNLVREVAYEQWHRLLFARFLEVNGLLRHPEFRDTSLTLEDCSDLADDLGEPDGWSVAALFASEILPGVFRLDDPTVQVRFATEHRLELERILLAIPPDVFTTEDALGWVYQFWQTAEKKRVNESGVKIGGADLSPVTQLFTENYMVRFLLENSLGAWWAARHPESPLIGSWVYLRRLDDGTPAAGKFPDWPTTAAEITVMDPCCGSGHFLVEAFSMLWQMRAEEEGTSPVDAQDAVLRDNLFGLELDPRCVQIAMFAVALEAWKTGRAWRPLPMPNIACSGIPVRASVDEWHGLAGGDQRLENALARLHVLFRNADTLGSLIDPRLAAESSGSTELQKSFEDLDWEDTAPLVLRALEREEHDPATAVLGIEACSVARAADYLSRRYLLVVTNVPYLSQTRYSDRLSAYIRHHHAVARADIGTAFLHRFRRLTTKNGIYGSVSPMNWLYLSSFKKFRSEQLSRQRIRVLCALGAGAFEAIGGEVVKVVLSIIENGPSRGEDVIIGTSPEEVPPRPEAKVQLLTAGPLVHSTVAQQRANPDSRITLSTLGTGPLLSDFADSSQGICTGDYARFGRYFWEVNVKHSGPWAFQQSVPTDSRSWSGCQNVLFWEGGHGSLLAYVTERLGVGRESAWIRGTNFRGRVGVAITQAGSLSAGPYSGELFDNNTVVLVAKDPNDGPALVHFVLSDDFAASVRRIDTNVRVADKTMLKVPFDVGYWRRVAEEAGPLPEPRSDDPTQWLFRGDVLSSTQPLQVAVSRLLGYQWPDHQPDDLDQFIDADGIAALQALPGEPDLATRLRELLATAYGDDWSNTFERSLVTDAGGNSGRLEDWLRDGFFSQHVKLFGSRPFLWHIWDGRKDGFSAIVNYHRLDHRTLEKLTFTVLGAWIERQKYEADAGRAGADTRLAAALDLQGRLKLILDGAPPYDVYVRWKEMSEQPIGWDPNLDDGIRLNIRPFVTAEVLRSRVNVHWKKDRGTDPDGTERINDLHPTLVERRAARQQAGTRSRGSQ